ncbi:MAG: aldehyde dehydrogenase family protein [Rubrivivax sp.]
MNQPLSPAQALDRVPFLRNPAKGHFIGGKWVPSVAGESFETFNPANGQVLATLARGRAADVDAAVAVARRAFEGPWSRFTPHQRQALLHKVCGVLEAHFDELALLESLDVGVPISLSRKRRGGLIQTVMYFASQAVNWSGTTMPNSLPGQVTTLSIKAPIGVVGGILPWNAPLISMWWVIGGALATGCTAVIKAAEDAALTTLRTAELLSEAGVPDGVINIVTGFGPEAGAPLAAHLDVDRLAFTGSTVTGREIIKASAGNMKRLQLELGGKSPDIVFADADLDKAVPGVSMGVYNNSGQICSAGTRIFVQRSIQEEFVARAVEYTKSIRVGNPFDEASQLGPVISKRQLDRVLGYLSIGREEGAEVAIGGSRLGGELADGYFVAPTLFSNADNGMRIAREEIFGPVAAVIPFDTAEDALRLANDTTYGLAGACWTRDVGTMMKMMHGMKTGRIWFNCYGLTDVGVSFSGVKHSGYGMKSGPQHIEGFLYEKAVFINGD